MKNHKVLIVEDCPTMQDLIATTLTILEISDVIKADNGKEGLIQFSENYVDLIITDLEMPEMNGYEFIEKIREIDSQIPIIVCSANRDRRDIELAHSKGADAYIKKPFGINDFKKRVDSLLLDKDIFASPESLKSLGRSVSSTSGEQSVLAAQME
jgi:two-component system chemotaxis response regulator CheY